MCNWLCSEFKIWRSSVSPGIHCKEIPMLVCTYTLVNISIFSSMGISFSIIVAVAVCSLWAVRRHHKV